MYFLHLCLLLVSRFQNDSVNDTSEVCLQRRLISIPMQAACNTYGDARRGNLAAQNAGNPFSGRGSARTLLGELIALPSCEAGSGYLSPRTPPSALGLELRPSPVPHSKISSNAAENYRTTYIYTYIQTKQK